LVPLLKFPSQSFGNVTRTLPRGDPPRELRDQRLGETERYFLRRHNAILPYFWHWTASKLSLNKTLSLFGNAKGFVGDIVRELTGGAGH
jgi:hypothetical protein